MPKPQPVSDAPAIEPSNKPSCVTNWEAFNLAQVIPTTITCQDYQEYHAVDQSCHSRLKLDADAVIRHMDPDHSPGAGFQFILRRSDSKTWPGWDKLKDAGVEIHHIQCTVCHKDIALNPRTILKHMQSHSGRFRKSEDLKSFDMVLRTSPPEPGDEDGGF
jgi:hypothetical protein